MDDSSQGVRRLLAFLSASNPVAPTEGASYLQGPVLFAGPGHGVHVESREQQSLDGKLSSEMLKLVRRRYLSYG